uniref:Uncharacterized protein n=1 Tax=Anguilla anguilla TaxID=7936 RepID=A0A0E9SD01_ANGAN
MLTPTLQGTFSKIILKIYFWKYF